MSTPGNIGIPTWTRPLRGSDPREVQAVRDELLARLEAELTDRGMVRQVVHTFRAEWEDACDLTAALRTEPTELGAALLRHRGELLGAVRAFRSGEVMLTTHAGMMRAVGLLEYMPERTSAGEPSTPERWWLAYRLCSSSSDGVTFVGEWKVSEGTELGALDAPFRPWLETGQQGELSVGIARAIADPGPAGGRVRIEDLPGPAPTDARAAARWAEVIVRADLLAGRFGHVTVIVFRDRSIERWEIQTLPGCSLDDVVRNIALLAPTVAVALVRNAEGPGPQGDPLPGLAVVAECAGRQWADAWLLQPTEDGVDRLLVDEQDLGDVKGRGWIGVAPVVRLSMGMPKVRGAWGTIGEA